MNHTYIINFTHSFIFFFCFFQPFFSQIIPVFFFWFIKLSIFSFPVCLGHIFTCLSCSIFCFLPTMFLISRLPFSFYYVSLIMYWFRWSLKSPFFHPCFKIKWLLIGQKNIEARQYIRIKCRECCSQRQYERLYSGSPPKSFDDYNELK